MDVAGWQRGLGLDQYAQAFADNDIDLGLLPELDNADLKDIGVASLGHRKKILAAIAALDGGAAAAPAAPPAPVPGAEHRQLSVMFVDLAGSTALSETLDAEDLREVIRWYQETCAAVIAQFDGFIARYMGDGMLVYFGYPSAHEDDAERATEAGLGIIEAIRDGEAPENIGVQPAVRVAVATGPVVVGDIVGEGAAQEAVVLGETPNLAARLQGLADENALVIDENTRQLVGGLFETDSLGRHPLKGFAEPVAAFAVTRQGRVDSRFEATHGQTMAPLIGRDEEIELLRRRWQRAKEGAGQIVFLSGEAGIGKSRLVQAMREHVEAETHFRLRYQCSPRHTNSAFRPLIERIERAARIDRADTAVAKRDKLRGLLAMSGAVAEQALALFCDLVSVPGLEQHIPAGLTPQQHKQRIIDMLVEQVETLAATRPLLFVFEDAHWADPSTLEFLDRMVERVPAARIAMLITFRPQFQPPWAGATQSTWVTLSRLPGADCAQVVRLSAARAVLSDEVVEQIVARTDGVPLFAEELTKAIIEQGGLGSNAGVTITSERLETLGIPGTFQSALLARLDRFPHAREVAQLGAVIGREFDHEILAAVTSLEEAQLASALADLMDSELVHRRGTPPEATYTFKHALVQETAYQNLLRDRRRDAHLRIAEFIETARPEARESEPELLAHHFTEAAQVERATPFWLTAGEHASIRSGVQEALAHLQAGLDTCRAISDPDARDDIEIDLQLALATALIAARGYSSDETLRAYERARHLLEERPTDPRQLVMQYGLYVGRWTRSDYAAALASAEAMVRFAERADSQPLTCVAHRSMAMCHNAMSQYEQGLIHAERAFAAHDPERDRASALQYGHDIGTAAAVHVGIASCFLGDTTRAENFLDQAMARAKELDHAATRGFVGIWRACAWLVMGQAERCREEARAIIEFSDQMGIHFFAAHGRGMPSAGLAMGGDAEATLAAYDESMAMLEEIQGSC